MKLRIPDTARLSFPLATAIAAVIAAQSASAQSGTWVGATGNWNDTSTWFDGIIADGTGFTANFTGVDIAADQTITLIAPQTIGNITFTDATTSSNNLFISGASPLTLDVASGAPAINVTQSGRALTINSVLAGNEGLQKTGAGNLILNGSAVNTFTGGLNLGDGTLTLDYNNLATPTDLIVPNNALQLNNGALTITGNATTDTVQTLGDISLGAGINTLRIAKGASATSATLNLGALTIVPGSATMISTATAWVLGTPSTTEIIKVTSIHGKPLPTVSDPPDAVADWRTVNAGLFFRSTTVGLAGTARWVNVNDAGQLTHLPTGTITQGTSGTTHLIRSLTNANATLDGNAESYGLVIGSNNNTRLVNIADFDYTINGILHISGSKGSITSGPLGKIIIGAERNFVINMDNTGGVDINAPIVDNGDGASSVTIVGTAGFASTAAVPGTVLLAGANTYTGATLINNGTVTISNGTALGTTAGNTTIVANGGSTTGARMQVSGGISSAENITITGGGEVTGIGFNAAINNIAGINTLSGDLTLSNPTSGIRLGSSGGTLTFSGNITQTGTTPRALVLQVSANGSEIMIDNPIVNLGGALSVFGAGPSPSIIGGTVTLKGVSGAGIGGTLLNQNATLKLGVSDALNTSANLTIANNGSTNDTFDLASFNQTVNGLSSATGGNRRVTNSATSTTSTLTVGNGGGSATFNGVIQDGSGIVALTKTGAGTQTLAGANTYTGITTVSQGTLSQKTPNSANEFSTVSIASDAFLNLDFDETSGPVTDTVDKLFIGGVQQPAGTYKANDNDTDAGTATPRITGPGTLTVTSSPVAGGYAAWAAINAGGQGSEEDFDNDGVKNGVEFFLNAPAGFTANPQLGASNIITWPNGGNIPASAYGTQFVVQTSPDLVNWTPVLVGDLTTNTGSILTYTLTGGSPRFVRLSVNPD